MKIKRQILSLLVAASLTVGLVPAGVTAAGCNHRYDYNNITWEWASDYSWAKASVSCIYGCGEIIKTADATVTKTEYKPDCTYGGYTRYFAQAALGIGVYSDIKTEPGDPPTGHNYDFANPKLDWSDGCSSPSVIISCTNVNWHTIEIKPTSVAMDYEGDGKVKYTVDCEYEGITRNFEVIEDSHTTGHIWQDPIWEWNEDDYSQVTAIFTCKNNDSHTIEIPAIVDIFEIQANCTNDGRKEYSPSVYFNGSAYYDNERTIAGDPATGHDWDTANPEWDWNDDIKEAYVYFDCKECNELSSSKADVTKIDYVDSTCLDDGYSIYKATATHEGETYTDTKSFVIKSNGHWWGYNFPLLNWSDGQLTGTITVYCLNDISHSVEITPTNLETNICKPATCEDEGEIEFTAKYEFEGDTYNAKTYNSIPATGHSFTNYIYNNDATCTEDGTKTAKCDYCDVTDTITDVGSATGHSFTNYVSNNDATCTEDGTKTAKCDNCDETDTRTATWTATWHTYGEPVWNWAEDHSSATATFTCESGDDTQTVEAVIKMVETEPTATENGVITYTATVNFGGVDYTDVKTALGKPATGTTDDGTTDEGSTDNGTTDNDSVDDSTSGDNNANNDTTGGTADDGSTDNGTTGEGVANEGTSGDNNANNDTTGGTADDGTANEGATNDGTANDGSSDNGSAEDDKKTDGDKAPATGGDVSVLFYLAVLMLGGCVATGIIKAKKTSHK